jgi:hypothetical protein
MSSASALQHHEMLHQGLPRRSIMITDNAIIPLKERGRSTLTIHDHAVPHVAPP